MNALIAKILFFFAGLTFSVLGWGQDIRYFSGDFQALLKEAERSKKPILIDFYTDWCGYCKKMDATTLRDPSVMKLVNQHFVPIKINAEKGEGADIARQYKVSGYPTFLFLNEKGEKVLKAPGFKSTYQFRSLLEEVLNKAGISAASSAEETAIYEKIIGLKPELPENSDPKLDEIDSLTTQYAQRKNYFEWNELKARYPEYQNRIERVFHRETGDVEAYVQSLNTEMKPSVAFEDFHWQAVVWVTKQGVYTDDVIKWINVMVLKYPQSAELLLMKSWVEYKQGDKKEAKSDAKGAKKSAPKNSEAQDIAIQFLDLL